MPKAILFISIIFAIITSLGSASGITNIENLVEQIGAAKLSAVANETFLQYTRSIKVRQSKIPSRFWAEEIKNLRPIRLYTHRLNIVVVLHEDEAIEEGLYIYIMISSYMPRSGDDGFTFTYLEHNISKYRRDKRQVKAKQGKRVLFGTVVNRQGKPVPNARVFASYAQHGKTNKSGEFALRVSPIDSSGEIGIADFPIFVWAFAEDDPYHVAWTLIRHPKTAEFQFQRMQIGNSFIHTSGEWEEIRQRMM